MQGVSAISSTHFSRSQVGYIDLAGSTGGFIPDAEAAAIYVITAGTAWLQLGGASQPAELVTGDVAIVPCGDAHSLCSEPGRWEFEPVRLIAEQRIREFKRFRHGAGPVRVQFMAARCTWEDFRVQRALHALPSQIILRGALDPGGSSVASLVSLIDVEATLNRPASPYVINRLCDALMMQAVAGLPDYCVRPAGHPGIARALRAIDAALGDEWTSADLARIAGMSRTAFVQRFTRVIGQAPAQYVTERRLQYAAKLLRVDGVSVAEVADRVGYGSLTSFATAFRRRFKAPPARWRRSARALNPG
ncbi:AraC family transcriptional regulator [Bradyrhizobium sp. AZCC 1693]|uniref:AraC family transcriptional regulator n=1 Tax=Bradyrhizobium sp. AZCC 1693 TaxID=3117029 RepID=UPI002FF2BFA8